MNTAGCPSFLSSLREFLCGAQRRRTGRGAKSSSLLSHRSSQPTQHSALRTQYFILETLEPRLLLSAAPVALAPELLASSHQLSEMFEFAAVNLTQAAVSLMKTSS